MKSRVWILLGLIIIGISFPMNYPHIHITSTNPPTLFSKTQTDFSNDSTQGLINESFVESILNFLSRSQDTGDVWIPSMDIAYFLASSLENLKYFENVTNDFREEIIEFVRSARNIDGGYGNWRNARSSMESTYQAVKIYSMYDMLPTLTLDEINKTLNFIKDLKTDLGGYFPLPDWDVPDVSSTYRALWIKYEFYTYFPSLNYGNDSNVLDFVESTFIPPFFISGSSGYSEVVGGKAEILASNDALKIYNFFNQSNPHAENIAYFLRDLTSPSGGVSGYFGGTPKTGYTAAGINLYLLLDNYTSFNLDTIVSSNFINDAFNYIKVNKLLASGFTASERDETPEIRSTHLALNIFSILKKEGLLPFNPETSGIYTFLIQGNNPTYGFGDYPGDKPDMVHTTRAILIPKLLGVNNESWFNPGVHTFVKESYNPKGGFGYRPKASPLIKYTYYGLRIERCFGDPIITATDIEGFILDSQNDDGGFGESPKALLSYMTHTYWAVSTLKILNLLDQLKESKLINWLKLAQNYDGFFSNYPGINKSITSTYRAVSILNILDHKINLDLIASSLLDFQLPNGGFLNKLNRSTPTIEATFYGLSLALQLNITINTSKVLDFVFSLRNPDGGFAPRPGFSSRISGTYFAVLTLDLLQSKDRSTPTIFSEDPIDFYAPIIRPAFVRSIDTNKTILGSYKTSAKVYDPESGIGDTWIDTEWILSNGSVIYDRFYGKQDNSLKDEYIFVIGPFRQSGILRFRIFARDIIGNQVKTDYYQLKTSGLGNTANKQVTDIGRYILSSLPIFMIIIGFLDSYIRFYKKTNGDTE